MSAAHVKVRSAATGLERAAQTNGSGLYELFDLPPKTYAVTFAKANFKTTLHSDAIVQANRTTTVDDTLSPATVSAAIEVTRRL
jgi:Carboxypeptidase regulatory-like domain